MPTLEDEYYGPPSQETVDWNRNVEARGRELASDPATAEYMAQRERNFYARHPGLEQEVSRLSDADRAFQGRSDVLGARMRSMADQIPGNGPELQPGQFAAGSANIQPGAQQGVQDWARRTFMSGGGGDIRNIMQALGPAVQAAGGLQNLVALAQRMGMPAKASAVPLDAADELFQSAVSSAPAQAMRGVGAAQGGAIGPRMAAALAGAASGVGYGVYSVVDSVGEMMKRRQEEYEKIQKQIR